MYLQFRMDFDRFIWIYIIDFCGFVWILFVDFDGFA